MKKPEPEVKKPDLFAKFSLIDGELVVHATRHGPERPKGLTHTTVSLNTKTRTLQFKDGKRLKLPKGVSLEAETTLRIGMIDENGERCKQTREIHIPSGYADLSVELPSGVKRDKKKPEILIFAGISKTPRRRPGNVNSVTKYEALVRHEGVPGITNKYPKWMEESAIRQYVLWNSAARRYRSVLENTGPYSPEVIQRFVETVIVPELDAFNNSLGRSQEKITYPAGMKREGSKGTTKYPTFFRIRSFGKRLKHLRDDEGKRIPESLLAKVEEFVKSAGKIDYKELNRFASPKSAYGVVHEKAILNVRIAGKKKGEFIYRAPETIEELEQHTIRSSEFFSVKCRLETALKQRKTNKLSITEGWPQSKHGDPLKHNDWVIRYYGNGQEITTEEFENGVKGVTLQLGPPLPIEHTAHSHLHEVQRKKTAKQNPGRSFMDPASKRNQHRKLRPVTLSFRDDVAFKLWRSEARKEAIAAGLSQTEVKQAVREAGQRAHRQFTFAIVQHRPLPSDAFIKGFELVHREDGTEWGSFWLCLTIEAPPPKINQASSAAAVHLGWRMMGNSIRMATIYDPSNGSYSSIQLALDKAPRPSVGFDPKTKTQFKQVIPLFTEPDVIEIGMGPGRRTRRNLFYKRLLFPSNEQLGRTKYGRALRDAIALAQSDPAEYRRQFHKQVRKEDADEPYEICFVETDAHRSLAGLQTLRDIAKDVLKAYIFEYKGRERLSPRTSRAGFEELHWMGSQFKTKDLQDGYRVWAAIDKRVGKKFRYLWDKVTVRLESEYYRVATGICKMLQAHGVTRLGKWEDCVKKLAELETDEPGIKLSQKYRQWAAIGKFNSILVNTVVKYGIKIVEVSSLDITRKCAACGYLNPLPDRAQLIVKCENPAGCHSYNQDHTGALNIARGADALMFEDGGNKPSSTESAKRPPSTRPENPAG